MTCAFNFREQGLFGQRPLKEREEDFQRGPVQHAKQIPRPSIHLYSKLEYRFPEHQRGRERVAEILDKKMLDSPRTPPPRYEPDRAIRIVYTNYRGETAQREVVPQRVWFGATEWHPEEQWLLDAIDIEKGAERSFALRDIREYCD